MHKFVSKNSLAIILGIHKYLWEQNIRVTKIRREIRANIKQWRIRIHLKEQSN